MPTMHGGAAAMNHVSHGDDTATPACAARSRHSRFCAAPVRNRLDEKLDTCMHCSPHEFVQLELRQQWHKRCLCKGNITAVVYCVQKLLDVVWFRGSCLYLRIYGLVQFSYLQAAHHRFLYIS